MQQFGEIFIMKSHFSRFLYHTLSHLGGKPDTSSSLSYSDLIGVSRSNQVANLSNLDHRVKPDGDREGVDTSFKPEYDMVWCKRRLKFDFIAKILSKSWF